MSKKGHQKEAVGDDSDMPRLVQSLASACATSPEPESSDTLVDIERPGRRNQNQGNCKHNNSPPVKIPPKHFLRLGPGDTENSTAYRCVLCSVRIQCQNNSRFNCKRHYKRSHKDVLADFELNCVLLDAPYAHRTFMPDSESASPTPEGSSLSRGRQMTIAEATNTERRWTQEQLDLHVLKYVILGNTSMNQVTSMRYRQVVWEGVGYKGRGLNYPSRRKLARLLVRKYAEKKAELTEILRKARKVATTADAWSSWNAGFLGCTVHWFNETLERKSACLGLKRLIGRNHFEKLAQELCRMNDEFQLSKKIARTTTDNGSNFCKSFVVYGEAGPEDSEDGDVLVLRPSAGANSASGAKSWRGGASGASVTRKPGMRSSEPEETGPDDENYAPAEEAEDDSDDDVLDDGSVAADMAQLSSRGSDKLPKGLRPFNIAAELDDEDHTMASFDGLSDSDYSLPLHFRCVAHTLNLVATTDAAAALQREGRYTDLFNGVMTKLRALWTRQSKSTLASDTIRKKMRRLFKTDVKTRWNSSYDAMKQIVNLSREDKQALNELILELGLNVEPLRPVEFNFMAEYLRVMEHLADALDVLQGQGVSQGEDPHLGMGYLAPIIGALLCTYQEQLEDRQDEEDRPLRYCRPLVEALLAGLKKRFDEPMNDDEILVAAAVHPKFRLDGLLFLPVHERDRIARLVKQRVARLQEEKSASSSRTLTLLRAEDDRDLDGPPKKKSAMQKLMRPVHKLRTNEPSQVSGASDPNVLLNQSIDAYLNGQAADDLSDLNAIPLLKLLFVDTNTALPSSAPVERLFSVAGHIFIPSRSRLKDAHLEPLVFLRANYDLLGL